MRVKLFILLAVLTLFPMYSSSEDLPVLRIITERFKPYNFIQDGELKGIAVEILELMLGRAGSSQTKRDFEVMDWPRAYGLVLHNPMSILFSTTRTESRENLFKWVGPIDTVVTELFARKSAHITINSIDDLKMYRIGTIINDAGELQLINNGIPVESLYRVVNRDQIRKLLYSGRIDLTPDNKKGFMDYARKAGYNPEDFESVYVLKRSDLYYALNKDTPEWIANELQEVLDGIKEEGLFQKILDKYRNI